MSDYIKRSDAINAVYEEWEEWIYYDGSGREIASDTEDALCRLDAEDVAPVRHGRWIVGDSLPMHDIAGNLSWGNWYTCNQCEFKTYAIERHITQYNYCPNCGAKMDEEKDNED